jgi:uncharacterized protein
MYQNGFYLDPIYLVFVVPALLLTLFAQTHVRYAYNRWSQVSNSRRVSGVQVARALLRHAAMHDVELEMTPTQFGDYYSAGDNALRLSPAIAKYPTVASMCIVAHEIAHAAQNREGRLWIKIRSAMASVVSTASVFGYLVFFSGLLMQSSTITWGGVMMISMGMLFSLAMLPIEFDASSRALTMLQKHDFIESKEESEAAFHMLRAAAVTHIASPAHTITGLFYSLFLLMGNSPHRRRSY